MIDTLLYDNTVPSAVAGVLPDDTNPWPLPARSAAFLARLILLDGRRRVLEFGAGRSSVVLAAALEAAGGGMLTSVETQPEWCAEQWRQVSRISGVDAELVESDLVFGLHADGFGFRHARAACATARGPFDLVLVDAPQSYYGRDGAMHSTIAHLSRAALIVLDDAGRTGERRMMERWLRTYSGLRLVASDPGYGRCGIAVLEFDGDTRSRPHAVTLLGSAMDALRNAKTRLGRRALRSG